ncbi:MAG: acyl-CoA dehydrogenase family protein [Acidimicrobiia bacterium]|nr:acyl-CoA dehydrogenase family protein [Acidimicrobiia bacterium]
MFQTHEVLNQPPPPPEYDVYGADPALTEAVEREGAAWAHEDLHVLGRLAGSATAQEWGRLANAYPPVLESFDRYGRRLDRVDYHPAYHELMRVAIGSGLAAAPWVEERPGAHVRRAAGFVVWSQVDQGHGCPISMTYSVIPALRHSPDVAAEWEPRLGVRDYDPRFVPYTDKAGLTCGMAMTEKQGGSDVRANTSAARVAGDGTWRLTGHKWFCSAPMSDGFLALAQREEGLSCFLVPRFTPDGERNSWLIQRLKDKMGDRSNASSEVEFADAFAWAVGEPGRGVSTIIEMVNHTRLDCTLGSIATMRSSLTQALHHTEHRAAFGGILAEQPLMQQVLADLTVEVEAATHAALRLVRCHDPGLADSHDENLRRIATPVLKYLVCKRTPVVVAEALECLGGSGYVEESGMPRLFRQSPLNGIWEGSGNVICLDVLRAMRRNPESVEAFFAEVDLAAGADTRLDEATRDLRRLLAHEASSAETAELTARRVVERMALVLQGALAVRHAPAPIADAYCASRLVADGGVTLGTLPPGTDLAGILARNRKG